MSVTATACDGSPTADPGECLAQPLGAIGRHRPPQQRHLGGGMAEEAHSTAEGIGADAGPPTTP